MFYVCIEVIYMDAFLTAFALFSFNCYVSKEMNDMLEC